MTPPVARSILEKRIVYEDITQERFVKGLRKLNPTGH